MKKSSHNQSNGSALMANPTFTKTQVYLAVAFIYIYIITTIFF
ncbi:hypothetical protein SAMN04488552_0147 [Christiangramia echinicola]|uniref:Uncharacterized protein n=1 Tax=Christiangramia echinicola TaxID=279359 RepID=A0A1H1KU49_9FLAO|nr:hypothetical protein SAMN04488552_0147 [Christiangramia echinicola]